MRQLRRYEEAHSVYEKALQYAHKLATQHHLRGLMALCCPDYDTAIKELERAASLEPRNSIHWHALGLTCKEALRHFESAQAFDRALEIDPNDILALTESHDALQHLGCEEEIIQRLTRAVELDPNSVHALKLLAVHRCGAGMVRGVEGKKNAPTDPPGFTTRTRRPSCLESAGKLLF